jgi:hypothetical protein
VPGTGIHALIGAHCNLYGSIAVTGIPKHVAKLKKKKSCTENLGRMIMNEFGLQTSCCRISVTESVIQDRSG